MKINRLFVSVISTTVILTVLEIVLCLSVFEVELINQSKGILLVELFSEGFNLLFVFGLICSITLGYQPGKPIGFLLLGSIFFYISQVQDVLDELIVQPYFIAAMEIVLFPIGLVFISIGVLRHQLYMKKLIDDRNQLKNMYKKLSYTDNMTGLYNIRHFHDNIPKMMEKYQVSKGTLSLMLFDIDDFKKVNDSYGHLEGDRVIAYVGEVIGSEFGEGFLGYRYGGEEFIVVGDNISKEQMREKAEAFRIRLSKRVFVCDDVSHKITISVGIASAENDEDITALLRKADLAMYQAKTSGKNKVV